MRSRSTAGVPTTCKSYGKSRRALHEAGADAYWVRKPQNNGGLWFDGYDGHANVVIDEFYGWISRDLMCRLCDRYPLLVDTKGGAVSFLAKKIWITSNQSPVMWWQKVGLGPMERRLSVPNGEVVNLTQMWFPPAADVAVAALECEEVADWSELSAEEQVRRLIDSDGYLSDAGLNGLFEGSCSDDGLLGATLDL